ncbi:hypothetical protein SAMN05421731_103102 [Acinetobacter puyangensis]|uniref:Uncharacterized protein n=1 Tax=Acinetobacter puyangensis TaxID=1096779 RepID=A0A240E6H6_9GAMM|nr:hypothetical protein SAMN05421731_103102 [Acinetobacter puyangensis]
MNGGPFCTVEFKNCAGKKGANAPFFVGYRELRHEPCMVQG